MKKFVLLAGIATLAACSPAEEATDEAADAGTEEAAVVGAILTFPDGAQFLATSTAD